MELDHIEVNMGSASTVEGFRVFFPLHSHGLVVAAFFFYILNHTEARAVAVGLTINFRSAVGKVGGGYTNMVIFEGFRK